MESQQKSAKRRKPGGRLKQPPTNVLKSTKMSVLGKKWIIKSRSANATIFDKLLENRSLTSEEISDEVAFHDPFLMKDMQKSVDRIMKAIANEERIIIFGDYDVDGLTSTAILYHALKKLNAKHSARLPNREKDGYGLSKQFIDEFNQLKVKLVITVDTGISCKKEIDYANKKGIDIIVTDHHQVPETPPKAYAINHPKQKDCSYPYEELTGAGVAFKLAHALLLHNLGEDGVNEHLPPLVELAALGTIADLGELKDENRMIVKEGLKNLFKTSSPGLKVLKSLVGVKEGEVTTTTVGFQLAPRINAAGRIGDPYIALKLLIGEDEQQLFSYGKELEELNKKRQEMTTTSFFEAIKKFDNYEKMGQLPYILIDSHPDWHVGIIGLTASRLADRFGRPAIIFQDLDDTLVASARSIEAFNIIEAIAAHKDLLVTFGGHKEAAGLTIKKKNFKKFKAQIESYAKKLLKNQDLRSSIEIDCEIQSDDISEKLVDEINKLKPFGISNKRPLFIIKGAKPAFLETVGRNKDHLKFEAEIEGKSIPVIGFRLGDHMGSARKHRSLDLACHVDINEWNGKKKIQLELVDFREGKAPMSPTFDRG